MGVEPKNIKRTLKHTGLTRTETRKCKKCGSTIFFVDETITHLEVDGQIIKQLGSGDLHNRNCVRCNYPEQYENYKNYDANPRS